MQQRLTIICGNTASPGTGKPIQDIPRPYLPRFFQVYRAPLFVNRLSNISYLNS